MSVANTTRADRKHAWEQAHRITHKRLRDTARRARRAAVALLCLLFLAMAATMFDLIDKPLPVYKGITVIMTIVLTVLVVGGCVRAGTRVWRDAAGDKKVRLHLLVAPLVTLLLALGCYGLSAGAVKATLHRAVNFSFGGSELSLLGVIVLALGLYALTLGLLVALSLAVVRRLSMAIQAADDSDEDGENASKSPGHSRFVRVYVLAWFAWMGWLVFVTILFI